MKKNQFALIFLTVLTMLAVWYFKTASNKQGETPTLPVTNVSTRTEELAKLREAVRSERNAMLVSLNNIIADESSTLVSKTSAIEQRDIISSLNEQEVLLETKVMNLGYQDAFVHYTEQGVEVIVVTPDASATAALDVIDIIYETFDKATNVVVNFKTVEELKAA